MPTADHLGRWATAGIILSLLLHVVAFFVLNRMKIFMPLDPPAQTVTERVRLNPVDTVPFEPPKETPVEVVQPPTDLPKLLDEIDVLDKLPPDTELEIRPDVKALAVDVPLGGTPLESGDPAGTAPDLIKGLNLEIDLPLPGRDDTLMPSANPNQVVVERGVAKADEFDPTAVVDDLLKKGAGGKAPTGSLQGSIEEALGLPADVLVDKTTVLPSDLLFEYNSADLRESARVGLLKLGTLIDLNPDLYCWIEGYSDLFGGDEYNLTLSQRRADAVKDYLVKSLRIDPKRIIPQGFGKLHPRIAAGSVEEQAPNRRVEIKMRKTLPPPAPKPVVRKETPPPAPAVEPAPPKAVVVPPKPSPTPPAPAPPKARVVEDPPAPRAIPVEPPSQSEPPRALPVEE